MGGRYKVRPIGRTVKVTTKSIYVSIRAGNSQAASSSTFLARIHQSYRETQVSVPLTCRVELKHGHQLTLRLMYSEYLGIETVTSAFSRSCIWKPAWCYACCSMFHQVKRPWGV
jgi:hypothetical protein